MSVDCPIVGFLTDRMSLTADEVGDERSSWIQPRIEPEIAFQTSRPIGAPLDLAGARTAVEAVAVAAEIIDSRFVGYRFRLPDVVADNTSAAGVVVGPWQALDDLDALTAAGCEVHVGRHLVHSATGAAVLGHPLLALVFLAQHLAAHGQVLPAGSLVLAVALTDAVPLVAEEAFRFAIEGLGAIDVRT